MDSRVNQAEEVRSPEDARALAFRMASAPRRSRSQETVMAVSEPAADTIPTDDADIRPIRAAGP